MSEHSEGEHQLDPQHHISNDGTMSNIPQDQSSFTDSGWIEEVPHAYEGTDWCDDGGLLMTPALEKFT